VSAKDQPYSLHPSFAHWSAMLGSLEQRTGKDIDAWLQELNQSNAKTTGERRAFLKSKNLGAATVSLIVDHAEGKSPGQYDPQAAVDRLFKGPKATLLPLYEAVLQFGLQLGKDVKACPCATMVPLYRNHVFAQLKPAARTRLDLGLALGNAAASVPLIDTGGLAKKDRITHRLELSTLVDFNEFAQDWLRRAYMADRRQ
jgi:hypothetical protein